ncbi:MAG: hypothetical protein WAO52_20240 [Prolixibacteraceae bacterium]
MAHLNAADLTIANDGKIITIISYMKMEKAVRMNCQLTLKTGQLAIEVT